jgi:hypothetical protein
MHHLYEVQGKVIDRLTVVEGNALKFPPDVLSQ